MSNANSSQTDHPSMTAAFDMASLHAKMDSLMASSNVKMDNLMIATNATLKQLTDYMGVNDGRVDALSTQLDQHDDKFASLDLRLAALENNTPAVENLTTERELLKQQQLKCNICFNGIPAAEDENITNILKAIWTAIKVKVSPTDIINTHRTKPSQRSPGLICVKFASYDKKTEVMTAKRKVKLTLADLNLSLSPGQRRIFANHQMTPYYSTIFYKARYAQANGCIKTSWIGNNGMNLRLNDDSIKVVKSISEFDSVVVAATPIELQSSSDEDSTSAVLTPPVTNSVKKKKKKRTPVVKLVRLKRRLENDSPTNSAPSTSSVEKGRKSITKNNSDKKVKTNNNN